MSTKACSHCKQVKPVGEFSRKSSANDGLQPWCRKCNKQKQRAYYKENGNHIRGLISQNRKQRRRELKAWLDAIKRDNTCWFCHEDEPICLDFHHVGGKDFTIASSHLKSIAKLKKELAKCVVLCANCHRKVHAKLLKIKRGVRCLINVASPVIAPRSPACSNGEASDF